MSSDLNDADKAIAQFILSGKRFEPREYIDGLAPIVDADHVQIPWAWYALSGAARDLSLEADFLAYSERFCFSPRTQREDFRTAKLDLLQRRIKTLRALGRPVTRELQEYFAQSPSQRDVDQIRGPGVEDFEAHIDTFASDRSVSFRDPPREPPSAPEPKALGASHFCVRETPPALAPVVRVVDHVEYMSLGDDTAAIRGGDTFYRNLCRSESLRVTRERMASESPVKLGGTAVVLNDLFSLSNYCHWMCDWFPRLLIAREVLGQIDWVCARIAGSRFEMETLSAIAGVPEDHILIDHGVKWYEFDHVATVDNLRIAGTHPIWRGNPDVIELVKTTVLPPGHTPAFKGRRVYISRKDAGNRQVINEDALSFLFARYDVEIINMGGMSVRDQAILFSECELIIGVHGAGMANLMFMPAGGTVIELFHYQFGSSAYVTLARGSGHRYLYLSCDSVANSQAPETQKAKTKVIRYAYSDIWVEEAPLRRALAELYD